MLIQTLLLIYFVIEIKTKCLMKKLTFVNKINIYEVLKIHIFLIMT